MIGKMIQRMLETGRPARSGPLFASYATLTFFWVAWNFIFPSFRRPGFGLYSRITSFHFHDGAWYSGNRHQIWDYKFDHYCFDAQHIRIVLCIRRQFSFAPFFK